jgi:hypothetical protein
LHTTNRAAGAARGKSFCARRFFLGLAGPAGLRGVVLPAAFVQTTTMLDSLAEYPRWFVVACATIVLAVGLWIGMKLLKLALWLLIGTVLVVGLGTAAWLLLK